MAKPNQPAMHTPKANYKFLTETGNKFRPNKNDDVIIAAYFTESNQFMVTTPEYARQNVGVLPSEEGNSVIAQISRKCDLMNKVMYLYKLMDEIGFRIFAVFVLGVLDGNVFKAFDIYAGAAGQGQFLPKEHLQMFLDQINIPQLEAVIVEQSENQAVTPQDSKQQSSPVPEGSVVSVPTGPDKAGSRPVVAKRP